MTDNIDKKFILMLDAITSFVKGNDIIYICPTGITRDVVFTNVGAIIEVSEMEPIFDWADRKITIGEYSFTIMTSYHVKKEGLKNYDEVEIYLDHAVVNQEIWRKLEREKSKHPNIEFIYDED